jgi:hypothetical protein
MEGVGVFVTDDVRMECGTEGVAVGVVELGCERRDVE